MHLPLPLPLPLLLCVLVLVFLTITTATAHASYSPSPPRNLSLTYDDICPWASVYTPFTRWSPIFLQYPNATITPNLACWWWADCVFTRASEVRKQQFSATSFVMGLLPLAIKDIAWPEHRTAAVKKPLGWAREILVRGLGLQPVVMKEKWNIGQDLGERMMPRREVGRVKGTVTLGLLWLGLFWGLAMQVVMEYVSKRSSLGCPYFLFIASWQVVALVPAGAQVLVLRMHESSRKKNPAQERGLRHSNDSLLETKDSAEPVAEVKLDTSSPSSAEGQVVESVWWVQLTWAIYYCVGTLIYTSIMAVTVIELIVWMVLAGFITAMSKMLAYRLCGNWK